MKHLNKLASTFCAAALAVTALTGCEGSDIFGVNSPDWLTEKTDSIANSKNSSAAPVISPTTLGNRNCTDEWWASHLNSDIKIESNKVYSTTFTNYTLGEANYQNYVVVLRKADQTEYCCLRSDDYGWGDSYASITHSNTASDDWAGWLAQMNGAKVTVTVTNYGDNTADVVADVVGTDGLVSQQKYTGIPVESGNLYLDFTTDHCCYVFDKAEMDVADAVDQQPVSMELENVPEEVNVGTSLNDFTKAITAKVTYDGGSVKEVTASDLDFIVVPDFETLGDKYVVASLSKSYLGKTAEKTIRANAAFKVVNTPVSIELTKQPSHTHYYFYNTNAIAGVERTLAFDPTGLEAKVTYGDGSSETIDNSKLTFSAVPAVAGTHTVTVSTNNGKTAEVSVTVSQSKSTAVTPSPTSLGADDCTTAWWTVFTDDIKVPAGETREFNFTNYSSGASNWNNYVTILRQADATEYAVCRSDNYGWGTGYDACTPVNDMAEAYGDWAAWLTAMNGAHVKLFVTNCNNGTADIQAIVTDADGVESHQSYLGINSINPNDLYVSFTVDNSHLKFGAAANAKKRAARRR